jgi:hypothetical protein
MRQRLARVRIPPQTTAADLLTEIHKDLKIDPQLIGNLGAGTVGLANETISIPAEADQTIPTALGGDKPGFAVTITKVSPTGAGGIVCTITGHCGVGRNHRTRSVRLRFLARKSPALSSPTRSLRKDESAS